MFLCLGGGRSPERTRAKPASQGFTTSGTGCSDVASGRSHNRFEVRRLASQERMPAHEWAAAESLFAKLVARAYLGEHPESAQGLPAGQGAAESASSVSAQERER